jgi:hypothetical protein
MTISSVPGASGILMLVREWRIPANLAIIQPLQKYSVRARCMASRGMFHGEPQNHVPEHQNAF